MDKATSIKLAEQNVATFKARLATAADKDGARRQLKAAQARLAELRKS